MVVSGSSDPKGVVPLAGSPPEVGHVLQVVPAAGPDVQTRAEVAICLRVERRVLSPLSLLSGQLREKLVKRSKKFQLKIKEDNYLFSFFIFGCRKCRNY